MTITYCWNRILPLAAAEGGKKGGPNFHSMVDKTIAFSWLQLIRKLNISFWGGGKCLGSYFHNLLSQHKVSQCGSDRITEHDCILFCYSQLPWPQTILNYSQVNSSSQQRLETNGAARSVSESGKNCQFCSTKSITCFRRRNLLSSVWSTIQNLLSDNSSSQDYQWSWFSVSTIPRTSIQSYSKTTTQGD